MKRFILLVLGLTLLVSAHGQSDRHTVFLIGDSGEPEVIQSPMGRVLRREVTAAGAQSTVLYLGDNIYPKGMPAPATPSRKLSEDILQAQAEWLRDLPARGIFIPGNHDWQRGRRRGWEYMKYQQQFLDSLHLSNITLLPRDGCPGPVEIPLSDKAVLIIVDSQWWLHPWDKPGEENSCDAKTPLELMTQLGDLLERHAGKRVLLAAHHPLITYGDHGGVFTFRDHIFPLREVNKKLWIPLPGIGSIMPLYRKWFGHIQDVNNPIYKEYSSLVQELLRQYPGSIYAAGHEHALQYIVKNSTYHIVSGSGSKTSYVKQKGYARFARDVKGFVKAIFLSDGTVQIEYWQVDETYPEGQVVMRDTLVAQPQHQESETSAPQYAGQYVRVKASTQYAASSGKQRMLGANYRAEWAQEVTVPVFDLGTEQGGLKILQKGGGQQTLSLRLEDPRGREFVLRSIEKYPEKVVPEMFKKTFAQDLVQDQISAAHPYAALVVPSLAEAAGIYHTNPRLVYLPDDPRLGVYRKTFANTLCLFEERPAGDWSDKAYFGQSKNIINTTKVLERLAKDNSNHVDQAFVLRSRLFDMLIGDWDRHDDQWRWATFKDKKEEIYRPIPRDRDQAFFVNEGILPKIWSRRWTLPKLEGFADDIQWPSGLAFNARYFDRSFLNEPDEQQWIATARELQQRMTDEVIENAIRQWPEAIYKLNGDVVIRKIKARRAKLVEYAISHYKFLAREVDIPGSNKDECFVVTREPAGDVLVEVYNITKSGEKGRKIYSRQFKKAETHEIRLYGQGGDDRFKLSGSVSSSILVRVIGGEGKDNVQDQSHVAGLRTRTLYYDVRSEQPAAQGSEVGNRTSSDPAVNVYDRKAFRYDRLAPLVIGNFNADDGLFIGGGFLYQTNGFRKNPFRSRHVLLGSVAPRTNSYNFMYRGVFTDVIKRWGVEIDADMKAPNYVNNFFGLGNESVYDKHIDDQPGIDVGRPILYYRFRFEELRAEAYLVRKLGSYATFKVGPAFQRIEIEDPAGKDRFIIDYAATQPYNIFDEHDSFGGAAADFTVDMRNSPTLTTRGLLFNVSGRSMAGLDKHAHNFSSMEASLALYHSFRLPARLVIAARIGAGHNVGNYAFYQAQILSGRTELRGFRKTRFYGDSKVYTNIEARLKLLSIKTYLFPASVGILGFHDLGRVWYKNDQGVDPTAASGTSQQWHRGFGGGVWFTPFNLAVLSIEAGHSNEETLGYVRLGFLF